jgi:predicted DsbA family dithiol-disulfide isomerase
VIEIEVFADIVCPFAHVGLRRWVERRQQLGRDDVRLRVRAWPLEIVNGVPMDPGAMAHKVQELREQVAPDLFAGFDRHNFPVTTLPALALTHAAYRKDIITGESVALRLRTLLFDEGRNISQPEVLDGVARQFELPRVTGEDTAAVLADHRVGVERGVIGSPFFFVAGRDGVFCPSLDVSRSGDHLDIVFDQEHFDELTEACFR